MSNWLNRETGQLLVDFTAREMTHNFGGTFVDNQGDPASNARFILDPAMTPAEQAAFDDSVMTRQRDRTAEELDHAESLVRALAAVLLTEINGISGTINEILDAIDAGNSAAEIKSNVAAIENRPDRTLQQLRAAIRLTLGN